MKSRRAESKSFKQKLIMARKSPFRTYVEATVGNESIFKFIQYEVVTCLFGLLPGAFGFLSRKFLYPGMFADASSGLMIGRNAIFRKPGKIKIGKNVTIDDDVLIEGGIHGINIADGVSINRNCVIKAKSGVIDIGQNTNIGANTVLVSYSGIQIGSSVLIASGCHINDGGYNVSDSKMSMMEQGVFTKGPIKVGNDVWIATGAIVLGGLEIRDHAVVGAGSVVTHDVNEKEIVAGIPARLVRIKN